MTPPIFVVFVFILFVAALAGFELYCAVNGSRLAVSLSRYVQAGAVRCSECSIFVPTFILVMSGQVQVNEA